MKREEAIKRIQAHMDLHRIGDYPHIKLREALNMAISALREQEDRRWIPVAERFPENDYDVLVAASGNPVKNVRLENSLEIASYSKDEGWILECWPEWENPKITCWMPLPELPEEGTI